MIPLSRNSALKACVLLVLFAGRLLSAQQLGHYIGGFTGLENGSSAPPGFYAAAFGLAEPVNSIKDQNGNTYSDPT